MSVPTGRGAAAPLVPHCLVGRAAAPVPGSTGPPPAQWGAGTGPAWLLPCTHRDCGVPAAGLLAPHSSIAPATPPFHVTPIPSGSPGATPSPHIPSPCWRHQGGTKGIPPTPRGSCHADRRVPDPPDASRSWHARQSQTCRGGGVCNVGIPMGFPGTLGCQPTAVHPAQPVRVVRRGSPAPTPPQAAPSHHTPAPPRDGCQGPCPHRPYLRALPAVRAVLRWAAPGSCQMLHASTRGSMGSRASGRWGDRPTSPQGALAARGTEPMTGAVMPRAGEAGGTVKVSTWYSLSSPDPLPQQEPTALEGWPTAGQERCTLP